MIVRLANDNIFILPLDQSHEVLECEYHSFNNCSISKVCAQISSFSSVQKNKRPCGRNNYKAKYRLISSTKRLTTSGNVRRASHAIFSKGSSATLRLLSTDLCLDIFILDFINKPYLQIVTFYHYFGLCIARKSKKRYKIVAFEWGLLIFDRLVKSLQLSQHYTH